MCYYELKDFRTGMRVALHPALDRWMMGDRYGSVLRVGRKWVLVKLDSGTKCHFSPVDLTPCD